MDYNSTKNQDIKSKFVGIHIYANVNQMVEYILKQDDYNEAPFTFEDIENFYQYPEYSEEKNGISYYWEGGSESDKEKYFEELEELETKLAEQCDNEEITEDWYNTQLSDIVDVRNEVNELETMPQEIYEWWMCDSWLIDKLADLGHPVIRDQGIWGRCTTGQAILLDFAISKICEDMEILEGQKIEWKV